MPAQMYGITSGTNLVAPLMLGSVNPSGGQPAPLVIEGNVIQSGTSAISGNSVGMILTIGSSTVVALPSGIAFTYITPITNTRTWSVSVSGIQQYEVTGVSGTNMAAHLVYSGGIWSQDTTPTKICVRVATATSGTVEMWAP